ncbi:MAG: glycosyltransferase [Candidatus Lernaella stagnicola]|nr:glycosyltransferase [Candidatus Lernaella stagnicola]
MKIALVHDWLTGMRGGEKVLEVMCEIWPDADLFTLLHVPGSTSPTIENRRIFSSFIQKLPRAAKWYRNYLPLMPTAIEQFDLRGYDLVVSTSHCVAKGVITAPGTCHVSYLHTPMRYVWDLFEDYFGAARVGRFKRLLISFFANYLRMWDVTSSCRVDDYLCNSRHVAKRIAKYYRRDATVIHPPVDTARFSIGRPEEFYLCVSALAPYKRIDLAVKACAKLGRKLKVVGTGQDVDRLRPLAGPGVEFLGWQEDETIDELYRTCRAFIFPGEEDFGITPVEAQASGRPVIALGRGGALETVRGLDEETPTGVFFARQTVDDLAAAIVSLESNLDRFDSEAIRAHALSFDREVFRRKIETHVNQTFKDFQARQ